MRDTWEIMVFAAQGLVLNAVISNTRNNLIIYNVKLLRHKIALLLLIPSQLEVIWVTIWIGTTIILQAVRRNLLRWQNLAFYSIGLFSGLSFKGFYPLSKVTRLPFPDNK